MTIQDKRMDLYSEVPEFWANLFNEEYALYDYCLLEEKEVATIQDVTEKIGHIYFKTARLLRHLDEETLLELGFPKETLSVLRMKPLTPESVIARIDLVKTPTGYKHFEINADTPTFIMELFKINGLVTDHFGLKNPNDKAEAMLRKVVNYAIAESLEQVHIDGTPNVVFTSHGAHEEDRETVKYLASLSHVPCKYVPLDHLHIVKGEGLYDDKGEKIDVLYRQTYPLEQLIHDEARDGTKVGIELLELVEKKQLAIINPPSAFLLQSKAVQAIIWGMHEEESGFFTKEEHEWIEQYFLATYLEDDLFIEQRKMYVKKPSFGREGDTIEIIDPKKGVINENPQKTYTDSVPIFQEYVEMPEHTVQTTKGKQASYLLLGSFLLGGNASAIGFRAGNQITGNESYFLPVGIQ